MASPVVILKFRWFLTLIGVLLLCLLIWFAGPYFAFADVQPFAATTGRLVAILIVVLAWALWWQWKGWQASRATRELGETRPAKVEGSIGAADAQLRGKFDEAFAALNKSGKRADLLELPWYMISGPPGAGKTTLLSQSGLDFPLADRFGKAAVRGVGGTRSCDWWFTSEAILLDTAGRYTTQDSDESADRAGWIEFLTLLKKHRRRRPINGVLLAFPICDIGAMSAEESERHVNAIRRRLVELYEHLGIQLPVYFLFTKADLIAGFAEYFDDLDKKDREQVWGTTFTWDASREGKAQELLGRELDELVQRLAGRVTDRLRLEREAGRRAAVFGFPQQFASLKAPSVDFVRAIFANPALDDRVWLRGVYITSGTQEGTPIDRMLGALAKHFRLGVQAAASVAGRGKAYFIGRLLREVIFREAGLAGTDPRVQRRTALLFAAVYLGTAAVTALLVVALVMSYHANSTYLEEVASAAQPLATIPSPGSSSSLEASIPSLDAVRSVTEVAKKYHGHVPLMMRFGLYQGSAMTGTAEDAYFREMNNSLNPAIVRHFAGQIQAAGAQPDKLYEYLKAYLMLGEPKRRLVPAQIQSIGAAEWSRVFANAPGIAQRLTTHFNAFTDQAERIQPAQTDAALVERARASLQQASLPLLIYSRVRLSYADDKRQLRLDQQLGLNAAVMLRRSGKPLSDPLPALYTRSVFDEFNTTGKYELVVGFLKDSWVLGDKGFAATQSPQLAADVVQLYEQDYIRAWDAVLGDITVRAPRDTADAAAILGALSSPTSPLKRLLVLTDANTNLLKPLPNAVVPAAGAAAAAAGKLTGSLDKVLGATPGPQPGSQVTAHFAAVNALVAGAPGPAPIDQLLSQMAQAQQQLQSASGLGGQPGSPAVLASIQNALGAVQSTTRQLPPAIGGLIGGLTGQSQSVALGVAHSDLENRYQSQVVTQCRELLGSRYPFTRSSSSDVTLEDFTRVLGPGGLYDAFFQSNLAALVDTSRPTWRWKEGAEAIGGSTALLAQFQAAERVRQLFFKPGAPTPEVRFNVSPDELDENVDRFRLEIDGQALEYRHGPLQAVSMKWPGSSVGQAIASFEQHGGTHPQLSFQGPWALFRILDQAVLAPQSDTRLLATFKVNGSQSRVVFEAASVRNPIVHRDTVRFNCE